MSETQPGKKDLFEQPTQNYLLGSWIAHRLDTTPRESQHLLPIFNPALGRQVGALVAADNITIDNALQAAAAAFDGWSQSSLTTRSRVLAATAAGLAANREWLAASLTREQGKTLVEARGEVDASAATFAYYAEQVLNLHPEVFPDNVGDDSWIIEQEAWGPVAIMTPWNFPLLLVARKLAPALAAGCSVILKPDERSPHAPLLLASLLADAGLPAGVLSVLFGIPAQISQRLLSAGIITRFSFTGSVAVGRELARLAAGQLIPATLELGGHAPVIVWPDIDVDRMAKMSAIAAFRNAGQVCTSPTRFYVHKDIAQRFSAAFVAATRALLVGDGGDEKSDIGPLAHAARPNAVLTLIDDAIAQGGQCLIGGHALPGEGYFLAPTVLYQVPETARIMNEEPFGPVAILNVIDDLDQAIERANRLPLGLAAYVLSADRQIQRTLSRRLSAGIVGINSFTASSPFTPFGGVKHSGWGYEGGIAALNSWLRYKSIRKAQ